MADKPVQLKSDVLDALVTSMIEDLQEARGAVQPHDDMVARYRLLYQSELSEADDKPSYKGASRPRVTFCLTATQVITASVYPQLFGPEPIAHLEPYVEEAGTCAEMLEAMYQRIATRYMRLPGRVGRQGIYDALSGGTVVTYLPWRTRRQTRWEWVTEPDEEIDTLTGLALPTQRQVYQQVERVTYNLPWAQLVDAERLVVMPTQYADLQESPAVAIQWPAREDALWQGVADGTYDRAAVEEVLTHLQHEGETTGADEVMKIASTPAPNTSVIGDQEHRQPDRLPWITDVYFRYSPKGAEHATSDWVMTIYEPTDTVLQCRPSPYNVRPFAIGRPYTDAPGVRGMSLPMVGGRDAEYVLTRLMRNRINKDEANMLPILGVSKRFYTQLEQDYGGNLERFAGLVKFVPLPAEMFADTAGSKPWILLNESYNVSDRLAQEEMAERYGNIAVGADDAMKGVATSTQVTATQAAEMAQQSQRRMAMIVERLADWVVDMFTVVHELCRQYQQEESLQQLWVELHGEQALEYPLSRCYQYDYEISANGLMETMSNALRAEHATVALQAAQADEMIASDPSAMYQIKADFWRYVAGKRDPQQVLGSLQTYMDRWEAMQQQAAMMAQQQMAAEQAEKTYRMVYERESADADRNLKREGMERADANAQAQREMQMMQAMQQGGGA